MRAVGSPNRAFATVLACRTHSVALAVFPRAAYGHVGQRPQSSKCPCPAVSASRPKPAQRFLVAYIGTMETIRITTDTTRHAGCGGLLGMSEEAPLYIVEHEGLETRLPGVEMVCLTCGNRIRSQNEVEVGHE
jgi:hypothetical protein